MNVGQSLLLHCGVLHLLNEALRRFEAWLVVCADFHCCLLEYVSRCFSGAMLNDETSKSTQVHILFLCQQTVFDIFHEAFYAGLCYDFCIFVMICVVIFMTW